MTEKPLVSVIINCYNGEKYLREAVDSVLAQTFKDWELILWDNQSTDTTADIIKSHEDRRIKYYYAPTHTPLGEARNGAMSKARGDFAAFLDSDDIWLPTFLESCLRLLAEHNGISGVYTDYICFNTKGEHRNNPSKASGIVPMSDFIKFYDVGMSACLFDMRICREKKIVFDNNYSLIEDYDFFLSLALVLPFYYTDRPLVRYRMHENSLTVTHKSGWGKELIHLHSRMICLGLDNMYPDAVKWLEIRSVNADIRDSIEVGDKKAVWRQVSKNWRKSPKLLLPLLYFILGKRGYNLLYRTLRRKDYSE